MKAAIAVDSWKLPVYKKELVVDGFEYEDCGELSKEVVLLKVETDNIFKLKQTLDSAETKAQKGRKTLH